MQQAATVTISSALNLFIVGWMLVIFVAAGAARHPRLVQEAAMSGEVLLKAEGVGKRFGGFVALQQVDIELRAGERLGLIGPNGSGKIHLRQLPRRATFAAHDGKVTWAARRWMG